MRSQVLFTWRTDTRTRNQKNVFVVPPQTDKSCYAIPKINQANLQHLRFQRCLLLLHLLLHRPELRFGHVLLSLLELAFHPPEGAGCPGLRGFLQHCEGGGGLLDGGFGGCQRLFRRLGRGFGCIPGRVGGR